MVAADGSKPELASARTWIRRKMGNDAMCLPNFHLVHPRSYFGDTPRLTNVHHVMFHGCARRGRLSVPALNAYRLGDELETPLSIMRSGRFVPPIFSPGPNLTVLSAEVQQALSGLPNIQFFPLVFTKLFDWYWPPGDFSFEGTVPYIDPEEYCCDYAPLYNHVEPDGLHYAELILPTHEDLLQDRDWPTLVQMSARIGSSANPHGENILISAEMLESYPIISYDRVCTLWSSRAWSLISKYFDREFYEIARPEPIDCEQ